MPKSKLYDIAMSAFAQSDHSLGGRTDNMKGRERPKADVQIAVKLNSDRPLLGRRRDTCMPLLERERQHPGTPDQQSDTSRVAEPATGGDNLFQQNEHGDARDPVEVHHSAEK